jgi:hypothetical protein
MRPIRFTIAFLIGGALLPLISHAQSAANPSSVWVSAGLGGGWTRVSCAICRTDRNLGPTGYVRVGVPLRSGLLLGAEANLWTREGEPVGDEDTREWTRAVSAVVHLYPRPGGPFFVKAGLGQLSFQANDQLSTSTMGVQLGAGYEFRVGNKLYISNYLNLLASSYGSLQSGGEQVVDDVNVTLVQIGVGLTRK